MKVSKVNTPNPRIKGISNMNNPKVPSVKPSNQHSKK